MRPGGARHPCPPAAVAQGDASGQSLGAVGGGREGWMDGDGDGWRDGDG